MTIADTRKAVAILLFAFVSSFAQTWQWPAFYSVPQKPDSEVLDSAARFRLYTKEKIFENDENTASSLQWSPHVSKGTLEQRCTFETSGDVGLKVFNEFSDLSGSYVRDSVLPGRGALGLEWIPTIRYNRHDSLLAFQALTDLGPIMRWQVDSMPLSMRGGFSGTGWNEHLQPGLHLPGFSGTASGYYGGFGFGDPTRGFFGLPVFAGVQGLGRSIRLDSVNDGIGVVTGSALFARRMSDGDSIFAYYGDSLSNGKEDYWGSSSSGRQQYMSTPWRIARSLQAAAGIKGRERLGFVPAFSYSYNENSVRYPRSDQVPSDVMDRLNNFQFLATTDTTGHLIYRGGLRISYGSEVWMFDNDSLSQADITAKLNDHRKYITASDHYLGLRFPHDFLLEYKLAALRDSKTYDTVMRQTNSQSNDRITINHHLGLVVGGEHVWTGTVFGEYSIYTLNYLSGLFSSQNSTQDGYRVGAEVKFQPSDRFMLDEAATANAEVTSYEFQFPYMDGVRDQLPPYDRRVCSNLSGKWRVTRLWEISFRNTETYFDNGVWYGHEYFGSGAADTLRLDYYGIGRYSWDHGGEAAIALVKDSSRLEIGCKIQKTVNSQFADSLQKYQQAIGEHDILVAPYFLAQVIGRRIALKGKIARRIYTRERDAWYSGKFWDINIVGQAVW